MLQREDVVILDMEAGLEHLGRGTTSGMDQFIVVIEPGARSIQTYRNVKRLALELGVKQVKVVASKIRDEKDEQFILEKIPAEDFLGFIHYHSSIMEADRLGKSPYDCSPELVFLLGGRIMEDAVCECGYVIEAQEAILKVTDYKISISRSL